MRHRRATPLSPLGALLLVAALSGVGASRLGAQDPVSSTPSLSQLSNLGSIDPKAMATSLIDKSLAHAKAVFDCFANNPDIATDNGPVASRNCMADESMAIQHLKEVRAADRFIRAGLLFAGQVWLMAEQVKGIVTTTKTLAASYERIRDAMKNQGGRVALLRLADASDNVAQSLDATRFAEAHLPEGSSPRYSLINQVATSLLARSRDAYAEGAQIADQASRMQMRLSPERVSANGGTLFSIRIGKYSPDDPSSEPPPNPDNPLDPANTAIYRSYVDDPELQGSEGTWGDPGNRSALAAPAAGTPQGAPVFSAAALRRLSPGEREELLLGTSAPGMGALQRAALVAAGAALPSSETAAARSPLAALSAARAPGGALGPQRAGASFQDRYSSAATCKVPEDDQKIEGAVVALRAAAQANAAASAADMTQASGTAAREKARLMNSAERKGHQEHAIDLIFHPAGRF